MSRPSNDHVHHVTRRSGTASIPDIGYKTEYEREDTVYDYFVQRDSGVWLDVRGRPWRTPSDYVAHSVTGRLGTRSCKVVRPDYYTWEYQGVTPQYNQYVWTPFDAGYGHPAIDNSILDKLELKVMNKLASVDINAGAELAESRETLRMLANAAKTAAAAFKAVRRGDVGALGKALGVRDRTSFVGNIGEAIGKRRLEFEYGWKPLIQTTSDLVDKWEKGLKRAHILSARKIHSDSYPVSLDLADRHRVMEVSGSSKRLHIVKIFATPKSETLDALGQVGLTNPAGVLWELVPYSFVMDWFIPVSDILEAASLSMSMNCLGGYRACFQEQTISATELLEHEAYGPQPSTVIGTRAVSTVRSKGYWRQAYGLTFPWPKLVTKSPFSDDHVINAAALLSEYARRR